MDIVVRAFLAFLLVFAITRLIGRRELSTLEPYDLILVVVIGDLIQQGVTQSDMSFTGGVLAVGVFAFMTLAVSFLGFHFVRLRPVIDPEPLILLEDGKLIEKNLRKERITPEEVAAEARVQQIPSLDAVQWAVLETGGRISFIKKQRS
jgi:uncharacterized membrane protein YcaP (DUF421 family)